MGGEEPCKWEIIWVCCKHHYDSSQREPEDLTTEEQKAV